MAGGLTPAHGATCQLETSAAQIFSIAGKINTLGAVRNETLRFS